ncbi:hypothetical protein GGR50DRAFT_695187 [Xylaria sp. CBS 124048]|nr:hypothetical protein GGR50DRAFT_695187 [Xylaria sp. CBS 124048]
MAPPKQPSRDRDTHHAPMLQQRSPDFHRSASITARTVDPNAGLLEPSPSTLIGGLVVGCAIGGVALVWMIYYCWKYCRPRPSYYDDAVRIQKEGEMDLLHYGNYLQVRDGDWKQCTRVGATPIT